jgi:predicted nucleotidyltransferase
MERTGVDLDGAARRLKDLLEPREEVLFAYLHGSFLGSRSFRDVDIAVFLKPASAQPPDDVEYEIALSLRFEQALGLPVDIKVLNRAPLSFRYQASRGRLLISRDESVREEFLKRTWSDYFDFARLARIYQEDLTHARI